MNDANRQPPRQMSRRTFLCGLAMTTLTSALVAACGPPRTTHPRNPAFGPEATPPALLPSPMPASGPASTAVLPVDEFLALSAVLTGVTNLDPALGRLYLQSLETSRDFTVTVTALYEQAGFASSTPPTTIAALESAGLFAQEATRALADRIIELWYTGVYVNEKGEEVVATHVDALAWQTLAFTKPTTICGYPGFWSEAWDPALE